LLLLFGGLPGGDEMVIFAMRIMPDLKNHGTEETPAPTDRTKLFRIVVFLVD
jgi:hypothetical protein